MNKNTIIALSILAIALILVFIIKYDDPKNNALAYTYQYTL